MNKTEQLNTEVYESSGEETWRWFRIHLNTAVDNAYSWVTTNRVSTWLANKNPFATDYEALSDSLEDTNA